MKQVAILLDHQEGIRTTYDNNRYDWDSFIWGFERENIECEIVGEFAISSYEELLKYDTVIVEGYHSLTRYMKPLVDTENRPIIVVLEARSGDMAQLGIKWQDKTNYFYWLKEADYTATWCYHGIMIYKPKHKVHFVRPVPTGFRQLLENVEVDKQNYIVSPILLRGHTDYNILILNELEQLTNMQVVYPIQFDEDYEYWKDKIGTIRILPPKEHAQVYANAFCGIKYWPSHAAIGGRISYIMAKIGTPYISTPSMIQDTLYPELTIDAYEGVEGIIDKVNKLHDEEYYKDIVQYAQSRCSIIEQGGKDWDFIVQVIKNL